MRCDSSSTKFRKRATCLLNVIGLTTGLLTACVSDAALFDRGNGLIYDDVLNVTWLQDANLAASNKFGISDPTVIRNDGAGSYFAAREYIRLMNEYNGTGYLGYNDWRLPDSGRGGSIAGTTKLGLDITFPPGSPPFSGTAVGFDFDTFSFGGGPLGWNVFSANETAIPPGQLSELAYMFHVNLGNESYFDLDGNPRGTGWGVVNTGPFTNLQSNMYWYGVGSLFNNTNPEGRYFDFFSMFDGRQQYSYYAHSMFFWPVRDGDVFAVPEPAAIRMLAIGLGMASLLVWRKRRS